MAGVAKGGDGRGRSFAIMAKDIMEGYVVLNPLVLKKFDESSYKDLHEHLRKLQTAVRSSGVDLSNQKATRSRNLKIQRLHHAMAYVENQARRLKIILR